MSASERPHHPFRVTRQIDRTGPPLTATQRRVLAALVHLCPSPGNETHARPVAKATGVRLGAVVVILQSLEAKRLVTCFAEEEQPTMWSPTLVGRSRTRFHALCAGQSGRRSVTDGIA